MLALYQSKLIELIQEGKRIFALSNDHEFLGAKPKSGLGRWKYSCQVCFDDLNPDTLDTFRIKPIGQGFFIRKYR